MVDVGAHRKFVGNVCLYRGLALRKPPSYLRRNINAFLDGNELALKRITDDPSYEAMVANEKRSAGWNYPTPAMLADLVKGKTPVLRLDALQLRSFEGDANKHWRTVQKSQDDTKLDWLPNPTDELRLPCQVSVSVLDTRTNNASKRTIFKQSQPGLIVRLQNDRDDPYYDIVLDQPCLIEIDKLFVQTEAGTNGFRHWKRTVTAAYTLEVAIQCQDSEDSGKLLARLESRDASDYEDTPANEGILKACWTSLPECPIDGYLSQVTRARGHRSLELSYGMEVSLGWSRRRDSPLEVYNQKHRISECHMPTPESLSNRRGVKPGPTHIFYSFQEGTQSRVYERDDLACIWCDNVSEDPDDSSSAGTSAPGPACKSFDRLVLHYIITHSTFKFEVSGIQEVDGKNRATIALSLKEKQSSLDLSGSPADEEINWQAPDRPFDLSAQLAGDEGWMNEGRQRAVPKRGPGRPARTKENPVLRTNSAPVLMKRPAFDEVEDLPQPKRKKHSVPAVANVTFYHTLSKQPIQVGEMLSESEDEMYDHRLIPSQRRDFATLGLQKVACDFHEAFNQHLDREQSASVLLFREAVVRFARKYRTKLQSSEWRQVFGEKLKHLRSHGIIDDALVAFCLQAPPSSRTSASRMDSGVVQLPAQGKLPNGHGDVVHQTNGGAVSTSKVGGTVAKPTGTGLSNRKLLVNRGAFVKPIDRNAHKDQNLTNGASQSLCESDQHQWSDTGADQEDVDANQANSLVSVPPTTPSAKEAELTDDDANPRTSFTGGASQTKRQRSRWDDGQFITIPDDDDDDVVLAPDRGHSSASIATKTTEAVAVSQPIGTAANLNKTSNNTNNNIIHSLANRNIQYLRVASEGPTCHLVYCQDVIQEGIDKPVAKLTAADLGYEKSVQVIATALAFDPKEELLVGQVRGQGEIQVRDSAGWHGVLHAWERQRGRLSMSFEIRSKPEILSARTAAEGGDIGRNDTSGLNGVAKVKRGVIDLCYCGKYALGGRDCVKCDNPHCARRTFHLQCVDLQRRSDAWRCKECASGP